MKRMSLGIGEGVDLETACPGCGRVIGLLIQYDANEIVHVDACHMNPGSERSCSWYVKLPDAFSVAVALGIEFPPGMTVHRVQLQ